MVPDRWFLTINTLMRSMIVFVYPSGDASVERDAIFMWEQINIAILDTPPKPLNVNVVQGPAFTIHTDLYFSSLQVLYVFFAGKLRTLIAIDDLRATIGFHCLLDHLQTYLGI